MSKIDEHIKQKIFELQAEREKGVQRLQSLQNDLANTQAVILRIEGAIAVLTKLSTMSTMSTPDVLTSQQDSFDVAK
jgi:predicted nuclease with TOPRIM domain